MSNVTKLYRLSDDDIFKILDLAYAKMMDANRIDLPETRQIVAEMSDLICTICEQSQGKLGT